MAFDLTKLRRDLRPLRLHWFPRLRSTSDHAAVLRKRGQLFAPAVVLTGHQLAGRGRGSHSWWSGKGSLTVTCAFAVDQHLPAHHIPLMAGVALRDAVAGFVPASKLTLKWPNDLLCDGLKIAGLLCERVEKIDLVGVGLNVNVASDELPPSLRKQVTSLQTLADAPVDMTDVLSAIARQLHRRFEHRDESSFPALLEEYDRHHALLGQRVSVHGGPGEPAVTGVCQGLDATGRLLLRDKRKTHAVVAGHVQWTPPGRR